MLHRLILANLILVLGGAAIADGDPPSAVAGADRRYTRAEVTSMIANARKIADLEGVEDLLAIPIGSTRQWISVRGKDKRNPVLLMIHGGPASPEMPTSWWFQTGWEDYFTVVQWDQRGAGKSYGAGDPAVIGPTLSLERITEDAAEVVQYLRARFAVPRIFVLGHSWGSVVGLSLAYRHPEWLYAYVGMGQVISGRDNERVGYERTLQLARARGDARAIAELTALAPYPELDGSITLDKIGIERKWSVAFGGLTHRRGDLDFYFDLAKLSPEYSESDLQAIDKGSQLSLSPLLGDMMKFDFRQRTDWRCPIVMFEGRYDITTPSEIVAAWMARVRAPKKKLVWFERSAHMVMVEEPGKVLVHLVQDVLPLAR